MKNEKVVYLHTLKNSTMKKFFLTTLLFLAPCFCFAQNDEGEDVNVDDRGISFKAPDYQLIKEAISDSNGEYYYPRLLERLSKGDTTLDINDVRCIYYGYALQPGFAPYHRLDEMDEIRSILFGDAEPSKSDFEKVVKLSDKALAEKPTELPIYYYRLIGCHYSYGESDPRTLVARYLFDIMSDAVYSSGNGSREAPFHLSSVMHSYFIMDMNNLRIKYQTLANVNGRMCDVFPLEENELGIDSLFFDINECIKIWDKSFGSHGEATVAEAGTQLELPLGTHFIIKLEGELEDEDSEFKVVKMESYDEVLPDFHDLGLFVDSAEANTIEGYFCRAKFGDSEKVVLIFKSWIEGVANFDTDIRSVNGGWEETSNSGIFPKVEMTEIWDTSYDKLRISNIRKGK